MQLAGRTALVTGASRGIGRAIALALAEEGADVAVNYVSSEGPAREVADAIHRMGRRAFLAQADVADYPDTFPDGPRHPEGVRPSRHPRQQRGSELRQDLREDGSRLVAEGAGHQPRRRLQLHQGLRRPDDQAGLRAGGEHHLGHRADRQLRPGQLCGVQGRGGRLHQVAGLGARRQGHHRQRSGPGFTETEMVTGIPEKVKNKLLEQIPMRRFGKSEEVARACVYPCSADGAYITGAELSINGGLFM